MTYRKSTPQPSSAGLFNIDSTQFELFLWLMRVRSCTGSCISFSVLNELTEFSPRFVAIQTMGFWYEAVLQHALTNKFTFRLMIKCTVEPASGEF